MRAVDGVDFDDRARRNARAGRRVRLRQVDVGATGRCGCSTPDGRPIALRRRGYPDARAERAAPASPPDADGVPGPLRLAEPARRRSARHRRRAAERPQPRRRGASARERRSGCWRGSGSRRRRPTAIRTNSPAASASASASRGRWRSTPSSSSATSRSRRSTSRCRPGHQSLAELQRRSASPTSSSRTISRSCTHRHRVAVMYLGKSSRARRARQSGRGRSTPIAAPSSAQRRFPIPTG